MREAEWRRVYWVQVSIAKKVLMEASACRAFARRKAKRIPQVAEPVDASREDQSVGGQHSRGFAHGALAILDQAQVIQRTEQKNNSTCAIRNLVESGGGCPLRGQHVSRKA